MIVKLIATFVGCIALWILFVAGVKPEEMIVGAISILLTALFTYYVIRKRRPNLRYRARDLMQVWRIPGSVLLDGWIIFRVLAADLLHFASAESLYYAAPYERAQGPVAASRRVLAIAYTSVTPNSIVLGINYYLTSDRFLDHRVELYPAHCGSAEGRFVDVEAVRLRPEGIAGFRSLLMEAWHRYRLPVAITEVHLGGPVADQIRWVAEAWQAARQARAAGADCIAVTIWALLGSHYWNELVTRENGHYEPGVFNVSSGLPVPSELADIVAQLTLGNPPQHACLAQPGWWNHLDRIIYGLEEDSYELAAPAC